ncbi:MAG: ATP-binding protein [Planctomycetaceae bacterium]|nr:ATP-binding protein [Planctomycetaceae bacterium]
MRKFITFSTIFFLIILVMGTVAFVSSMRQIIRDNKGNALSQRLEMKRIILETSVKNEVVIAVKMANSPLVGRYFANPNDADLKDLAVAELEAYHNAFASNILFWISDANRMFHYYDQGSAREPYLMDPENPVNYWYCMTLHDTEEYNFNINYNPDIDATNLWVNAPVFDTDGNPVGMVGTGTDVSIYLEMVNRDESDNLAVYFFNDAGEITGAQNPDLVTDKKNIEVVLGLAGPGVIAFAKNLQPGETGVLDTPLGRIAVGTIPLLDWYSVAVLPDSIDDYGNALTVLFIVTLLAIAVIFIIFNVFIAQILKPLRESILASEEANRAKSVFLANMSHEIRTPMNAIWGITEILMQIENLPAEIAEGLDRIYNSCDLLLGIINDILDFSKIEAGKMDITLATYRIASLINDSVNLNMMRIGSNPIKFELQVDENIPEKLVGDELRIKQVLNNLLSNAFKYTESGTVTLSVTAERKESGATLVLHVRDTGYGMTGEQLSKLFSEYYRFTHATARTVEGTGLGLAITHRLIYLMGGNIQVESEPGKGTLFTVRLPQAIVDDKLLGSDVAASLQQFRLNHLTNGKRLRVVKEPMPYGKVLIVDDMETNIYVAEGLMRSYGLQIDTATSGRETINKINAGNVYDIVFMDHMMPEMDGMETTKRLRDLGYTAPIVALTANAVAGQAEIFLRNGFDSFISKPIDTRQLNMILHKLIRDKQPLAVLEEARQFKSGIILPASASQPQVNPLLVESFIRDASKALATLEDLWQGGILETEEGLHSFTVTVHGIKGSLGNIGEALLADTANTLETAGREGRTGSILASAPEFIQELKTLIGEFTAHQEESGTDEDLAGLRKKLWAIQEMCSNYDRKGALELLSAVKNCSKETRELLDRIKEYVLHSEFEEAEREAKNYANVLTVVLEE